MQLPRLMVNPVTNEIKLPGDESMPYRSTAYSNDVARMVLVKFAWNFDFGRKIKSESKRVNNSDSDAGIVRTDR